MKLQRQFITALGPLYSPLFQLEGWVLPGTSNPSVLEVSAMKKQDTTSAYRAANILESLSWFAKARSHPALFRSEQMGCRPDSCRRDRIELELSGNGQP